jgi:hypothetical protein
MAAVFDTPDFVLTAMAAAASARIVYLAANKAADERLVVGVIVCQDDNLAFARVRSDGAWRVLEKLYGASVRALAEPALQWLDAEYRKFAEFKEISIPSSVIKVGGVQSVFTHDPQNFAHDYLETVSSVVSAAKRFAEVGGTLTQSQLRLGLFTQASEFNLFRASQMFGGRREALGGSLKIDLPIAGRRIFGTAVSLSTKHLSHARQVTESNVLRLSYLSSKLGGQPSIYLLTPDTGSNSGPSRRFSGCLTGLRTLAAHVGVHVRSERTVDQLAQAILCDDDDPQFPETIGRLPRVASS